MKTVITIVISFFAAYLLIAVCNDSLNYIHSFIEQVYYHHRYGGLPINERMRNFKKYLYLLKNDNDPNMTYDWDPESGTYREVIQF